MYHGIVPMLSKGSFSIYYGGSDIIKDLSEKMGSPVSPTFVGCSVILQLSVFFYKKIQASRLSPTFNTGLKFSTFSFYFHAFYMNTTTFLKKAKIHKKKKGSFFQAIFSNCETMWCPACPTLTTSSQFPCLACPDFHSWSSTSSASSITGRSTKWRIRMTFHHPLQLSIWPLWSLSGTH